jgi:hypothetical protein
MSAAPDGGAFVVDLSAAPNGGAFYYLIADVAIDRCGHGE